MKLLVNSKTNVVVFVSNHIEPHAQGFFVGDVIWPDPDQTLIAFEVEDEKCVDIKSQQYCYTTKKGFYLNPAFTSNDYVSELDQVKQEKGTLEKQLELMKAELEQLKSASQPSAPSEEAPATE